MSMLIFNFIFKLVFILLFTNINLISGQIQTSYRFCNEINTQLKINCSYPNTQTANNFYRNDGSLTQIVASTTAGYIVSSNTSERINYLEIKNLNTKDRNIVAGSTSNVNQIRCDYTINLYGNIYFIIKLLR